MKKFIKSKKYNWKIIVNKIKSIMKHRSKKSIIHRFKIKN